MASLPRSDSIPEDKGADRKRKSMRSRSRSPRRKEYGDSTSRKTTHRERRRSHSRTRRESSRSSSGSARPRRRRQSRSASPSRRHRHRSDAHRHSKPRQRSSSRSPERKDDFKQRSRRPLPTQEESYRGNNEVVAEEPPPPKEKPNFKPSGLLAAETNKVTVSGGTGKREQSIVLKYHEPPEARKPPSSEQWVMYIFKGDSKTPLHTVPLHERSCWLFGREAAVVDVNIEHPSSSKQHAVLQFRHTVKKDEWGEKKGKVGLYVLDLESANGTLLNGEKIAAARYVQIMSGDVIKFGDSEREYVMLLPPK